MARTNSREVPLHLHLTHITGKTSLFIEISLLFFFIFLFGSCMSEDEITLEEELRQKKIIEDSLKNRVPSIRLIAPNDSLFGTFSLSYELENWEISESGNKVVCYVNDEAWDTVSNSSIISFTDFEPGNYKIKMILLTSALEQIGVEDVINIIIHPSSSGKFQLVVINGSGTGLYQPGTSVTISASPKTKEVFTHWFGDTAYVSNPKDTLTTLIMPSRDIELESKYQPLFKLEVLNGNGSGLYLPGDTITVWTNDKQFFISWAGDQIHIDNVNADSTFVIMPDRDVKISINERKRVSFASQILPIFKSSCTRSCHHDFDLTDYDAAFRNRVSIKETILPGSFFPMPPDGSLPNYQVQLIIDWVETGAPE